MLRRLDRWRPWATLQDKRFCLVCGELMNGRDIEVVGGTRELGPLRLHCPTEGCESIPMDWVLPNDEQGTAARREKPLKQPTLLTGRMSVSGRLKTAVGRINSSLRRSAREKKQVA